MKIVGPNAFANALTGDLSYVQRSAYAVTAREGNECSSFRPRILRDWVLNPCVAESRIFREIRVRKLHPLLEGRRAGERASCYGCALSRLRPRVALLPKLSQKGVLVVVAAARHSPSLLVEV